MYDLIIKNVRIIDGTGSPWFRADVAMQGGKIAEIGTINDNEATEIIDGNDKYLSPGFIDIHSHSDSSIFDAPLAESRILQGITTEIGGNCGISTAPVNPENVKLLRDYVGDLSYDWMDFEGFFNKLSNMGISTNIGAVAGHGTLRLAVMGFDNRKPTEAEMEQMKVLLRKALSDGVFGMSSGLIYPPGCYADTEELIELSKELRPYGAFYATHMRDEATKCLEATEEALNIAYSAGVALQISHHKVTRKSHWHTTANATIAIIKRARMEGLDVMCDQYPYVATATTLDSNVPLWSFVGGMETMLERLENPETRKKMKEEANASHVGRWGQIYISYTESQKNQWTVGKSIQEIAEIRKIDPADACFDLIYDEKGRVGEVNFGMCEDDIELIMKQEFTMTGSDGNAATFDYPGQPHPRWYGTFPRIISHYCRKRNLFSLEQAIHKMTGLPAARLKLSDRGLIKEGMWADLVLFDFDIIEDTPTFENPKQPCKGILKVFVNGCLTAENGIHTGAKAGKVIRAKKQKSN